MFYITVSDESGEQNQNVDAISCIWYGKFDMEAKSIDPLRKTLELAWKIPGDAGYYKIFQQEKKNWTEKSITDTNDTILQLKSLGKSYCFQIRAFGTNGELLGISKNIDLCIPKKLSKIHTTVKDTKTALLSWKKSKGANLYNLYKKSNSGKYTLIKKVKKTNCTVNIRKNGQTDYKVIPSYELNNIILCGAENTVSIYNKDIVSMIHQKYSYPEMVQDIKLLKQKYYNYLTYESIGESVQGRKIYDVILGNPDAEHTILVISAIHAREYATTIICMKQLEYYLQNYNQRIDGKKVSKVFQKCNIHYVMMSNPDGVMYSQTKNALWKGNIHGVNLNRNFPYFFKREGSIRQNSYSGPFKASEKETKIIINLTKQLKKSSRLSVINYHAMGSIVFGDYYKQDNTLKKQICKLYQIARHTTGYADSHGMDRGDHGTYRDYLIYQLKVPSITIEIGRVACPLPQYTYASIFQLNKLVLFREAKYWAGN